MLGLAIKAGLPLIGCYTTDTVNISHVLEEVAGSDVTYVVDPTKHIQGSNKILYTQSKVVPTEDLYTSLAERDRTLIIVNQEEHPLVFNAGVVPTPKTLATQLLGLMVTPDRIEALLPSFAGLTLKDLGEVAQLTMAKFGALTSKNVMLMRSKLAAKQSGLSQVDTELKIYIPYKPLEDWVALNKKYFIESPDSRLVPRGILLEGLPGVGKSAGAKYIANSFDVPLYRLDLTSVLGKYVGDSESNFSRILAAVDAEVSCVLLIDEVEKIFSEKSDQGVTYRILSQLLWWMQERTSRSFVVMTTNDLSAIPPELYRDRRIDKVLNLPELDVEQAFSLAVAVSESVVKLSKNEKVKLKECLMFSSAETFSHAKVTQLSYDFIKEHKLV